MLRKKYIKESKKYLQTLIINYYELEGLNYKIHPKNKDSFENQIQTIRMIKAELLLKYDNLENGNDNNIEMLKQTFDESVKMFKKTANRLTSLAEFNSSN